MSAEPLPSPSGSAARSRRAEGVSRSRLGRPVLALVPNPVHARRAPFVALVLGILLTGFLGLLLLNTASAQDAFTLHRLESTAADAADERQALSEDVNLLTGPAGLAAKAGQMGMVPAGPPAFWKPGEPLPPGARVVGGVVVVPNATPAPKDSAATAAPAPKKDTSVTAVPRPSASGGKPSPSTSASASAKPGSSTKPSATASRRPSAAAKPTTSTSSTKPSTKPSSASSATTSTGSGQR